MIIIYLLGTLIGFDYVYYINEITITVTSFSIFILKNYYKYNRKFIYYYSFYSKHDK